MHREDSSRGSGLGFTEKDFKVCDFCSALNLVTNRKCFVCGWEGHFHKDSESVQLAIQALEREHGQLSETLFAEEILPDAAPERYGWVERMREKVRRFVSGNP